MLLLAFFNCQIFAQEAFTKEFKLSKDTIWVDTASFYSSTCDFRINGEKTDESNFQINGIDGWIIYKGDKTGTLSISYYRLPVNFSEALKNKNENLISTDTTAPPQFYSVSSVNTSNDLFGANNLKKQGSISRGVTVGNAQSLSVQSTLNLQLDGQIAENLFLTGSISDDNIPFQPEGSTQKLQEFDQVYLKIYNDKFALIGGDFWLRKPEGFFLNYTKRTQGASFEFNHDMAWVGMKGEAKHKISGAVSRGKFSRNIIQGVEGNQGPYRLTGAENEPFIVVLAGTERVYIDGVLMTRGQEFDYTINYNTAEITFTANQMITKDKRIIVEFQYSDLNYARSLFAYNAEFKGEKHLTYFNFYTEQDARNQTIQQPLTSTEKQILANAGDNLAEAFASSIDSVGFFENRVMYQLIDTLTFDSILVFSIDPAVAKYQASFQFVGAGNGNYILDQFTANGKVYRWVEPIGGIPQGDFEPVQILIAPQRNQMYTLGTTYRFTDNITSSLEVGLSNKDLNTFSSLDSRDNVGTALKYKWRSKHPFKNNEGITFSTDANFEFTEFSFNPIEWYRPSEFDRDWNVRNKPYEGNQYLSNVGLTLASRSAVSVRYNFENFNWGNDYFGLRQNLLLNFNKKGFRANIDASYLDSRSEENSNFLRHIATISQELGKFKIGFTDNHERNAFTPEGGDFLALNSYQWYDWKVFVGTSDSLKNQAQVFYQERYDWFSDSSSLVQSTKAQNIGLETAFLKNRKNIVKVNVNYRRLDIIDTSLFAGNPENTILNRIEHIMRLWKGAVQATTFYEIGSGLETKREFVFIEVNPGQGAYTWNDYNGDGIKDLGEFELAVYSDQGNYIRTFLPTNEFVRTYSNQFSTSLNLQPSRIWKSEKTGLKKFMTKFSNQTVYKINRKTNYEDPAQLFNPFVYELADTNLVSLASTFRNTFYFNKTNSVFGANYTYQENGSQILLSNGLDRRLLTFHEVLLRWNISKVFNLRVISELGRKKNSSDYATNRNFFIEYFSTEPEFSYQPNSQLRISIKGKYSLKENNSELAEEAELRDVGIEFRYNQKSKGSFSSEFNYINITYNGAPNTSIAFEMLESLQAGNNFTWRFSYQRKIAKNLQLNFNYNGRKSPTSNFIHAGGMELRAFF